MRLRRNPARGRPDGSVRRRTSKHANDPEHPHAKSSERRRPQDIAGREWSAETVRALVDRLDLQRKGDTSGSTKIQREVPVNRGP